MKELIVSLDLELNQPSGRIVQIGAVLGNIRTGEIVSRFDCLVDPGEPFCECVAELTGIRPEALAQAPLLPLAVSKLEQWLSPYEKLRFRNALVWGGGDTETLRREMGVDPERWIFGRRWIDVKTIYVAWRMAQNKDVTGGLARAMTKFGLAFQGRKHNAVDDALNTFRLYRVLLEQFKPTGQPITQQEAVLRVRSVSAR